MKEEAKQLLHKILGLNITHWSIPAEENAIKIIEKALQKAYQKGNQNKKEDLNNHSKDT